MVFDDGVTSYRTDYKVPLMLEYVSLDRKQRKGNFRFTCDVFERSSIQNI